MPQVFINRTHVIKFESTGNRFAVDETLHENEIRSYLQRFFDNPRGKRETFYRGQLIVRHTVTFTGCRPERLTAVYLVLVESLDDKEHNTPDSFCVSSGNEVNSIAQAKRLIDRILKEERYAFKM